MTKIYLIRHGQSPKSDEDERNRGLTEQGIMAAQSVQQRMMEEAIDVIISSPYKRAVLTVQPLAESLSKHIIEYEDLKECVFISDDRTLADDEVYPLVEKMFQQRDFANPGAESFQQCQARAVQRVKQLLKDYEGSNIVIGSHGFIMTALLNYFDESYGIQFLRKMTKPDIYCLTFDQTKLKEIEHLWEMT